jgi:hypothetical protein
LPSRCQPRSIKRKDHSGSIRLPDAYVAHHVKLAYATTIARAQGRTVETAHVLVVGILTREALYAAASRARNRSHLYVQTEHDLGIDAERPPAPALEAHDVVRGMLTHPAAEITATEVRRNYRRPTQRRQAQTGADRRRNDDPSQCEPATGTCPLSRGPRAHTDRRLQRFPALLTDPWVISGLGGRGRCARLGRGASAA